MGVPAKSARGSSTSAPSGSTSSGIGSASSAVTKSGSSMPSAVVPHDQQTSNESSTLDRHFGHFHIGRGSEGVGLEHQTTQGSYPGSRSAIQGKAPSSDLLVAECSRRSEI